MKILEFFGNFIRKKKVLSNGHKKKNNYRELFNYEKNVLNGSRQSQKKQLAWTFFNYEMNVSNGTRQKTISNNV